MKFHPQKVPNDIAKKIVKWYKNDRDVLAIFLSGSTIKGGTDIYSDIDINFIVHHKQDFQKKLLDTIGKIAKLQFYFIPPKLNHILVCYFEDLYKFDFAIYEKDKSLPIINSDAIIIDKLEILPKNNQSSCVTINNNNLTEKYLFLALADIIAISREVYRKDLFEARVNLDEARSALATYINLKNHNCYFGYDQFRKYISEQDYQLFTDSLKCNHDLKGILNAAISLLTIIKNKDSVSNDLIDKIIKRLLLSKKMFPKKYPINNSPT